MICEKCGEQIERNSNRQKYCGDCYYKKELHRNKMWLRRQRSLGTTDFFGHAKKDPDYEYFLIQQEKKKLRLK